MHSFIRLIQYSINSIHECSRGSLNVKYEAEAPWRTGEQKYLWTTSGRIHITGFCYSPYVEFMLILLTALRKKLIPE